MIYRDILKDPFKEEELKALAAQHGLKAKELINKKSRTLKKMGVDPENIGEEEAVKVAGENPRVLIRPIITRGEKIVLGFKTPELEAIL